MPTPLPPRLQVKALNCRAGMRASEYTDRIEHYFSPSNSSLVIVAPRNKLACSPKASTKHVLPILFSARDMPTADITVQVLVTDYYYYYSSSFSSSSSSFLLSRLPPPPPLLPSSCCLVFLLLLLLSPIASLPPTVSSNLFFFLLLFLLLSPCLPVLFLLTSSSSSSTQVISRGHIQYTATQKVTLTPGDLPFKPINMVEPLSPPIKGTTRGAIELEVTLPPTASPKARVCIWIYLFIYLMWLGLSVPNHRYSCRCWC